MATLARPRLARRPQLVAVTALRQQLFAADPCSRHPYLREFRDAYTNYESELTEPQLMAELCAADVVLVGDYHTLPSSQLYVAQLVEDLARTSGREVVLGLEMVYARDQRALGAWLAREIDERELRARIRYETSWGYEWAPFANLLHAGRAFCAGVYGVDCVPRGDLRRIARRDRHAAAKIAELRAAHPGAIIVIVFGEAHLAPGHLPAEVATHLPGAHLVTVLQNIDELYWKAGGERRGRAALKVRDGVVCVFNATPLEKYESYRDYIEGWQDGRPHPSTSRRSRRGLPRKLRRAA